MPAPGTLPMTTRSTRHAVLLAAAGTALLAPVAAYGASKPRLSWVRCYGKTCTSKTTVYRGGNVKIGGRGVKPPKRAIFKATTKTKKRTVKTQYLGSKRLIAHVPGNARSGRIYLTAKHGVRTNTSGVIKVKAKPKRTTRATDNGSPTGTAFDGSAMWIWNL